MRIILIIIFLMLVPVTSNAQVPEWEPEIVIKADYGQNEDQYGFEGIVKHGDTSPVRVFYVDEKHIYIHDMFQGNIKVYDISGKYLHAISTKWKFQYRKISPRGVTDLLVFDNVVYLLCEFGGIPPSDQSSVYILSFDFETGDQLQRFNIYNPDISRAANATYLCIGPNKSVWIYDILNRASFPFIRDGKAVLKSEHKRGISGELYESRRIVYNEDKEQYELISEDGTTIRVFEFSEVMGGKHGLKPRVIGRYSARNGEYFLVHTFLSSEFMITTWDGNNIGRIQLQHKDSWNTYPVSNICRLDPEGRFYRVFADYDGLYLFRWSN